MTARTRPAGCCPPRAIEPIPSGDRERLAAVFHALSDPSRIEILRLIAAQAGPVCACDVVAHFDLSQPTISHHLKVLREARLLRASKVGVWVFYTPDGAGLAWLEQAHGLLRSGAPPSCG
jgi:ArsR family transcriptional regulator